LAKALQWVIDELGAVVRIHPEQRKRQPAFDKN